MGAARRSHRLAGRGAVPQACLIDPSGARSAWAYARTACGAGHPPPAAPPPRRSLCSLSRPPTAHGRGRARRSRDRRPRRSWPPRPACRRSAGRCRLRPSLADGPARVAAVIACRHASRGGVSARRAATSGRTGSVGGTGGLAPGSALQSSPARPRWQAGYSGPTARITSSLEKPSARRARSEGDPRDLDSFAPSPAEISR